MTVSPFALVNTMTNAVVLLLPSLAKVPKPDGRGVFAFNAEAGDAWGDFKVLPIAVVDAGEGPTLVSEGAPVFDGEAVTVTRTWGPAAPVRVISPRAFRERMTEAEQDVIDAAAMTDAQVFKWRLRAAEAQEIDLDHPETAAGLAFLVSKGLLTEARAAELLA